MEEIRLATTLAKCQSCTLGSTAFTVFCHSRRFGYLTPALRGKRFGSGFASLLSCFPLLFVGQVNVIFSISPVAILATITAAAISSAAVSRLVVQQAYWTSMNYPVGVSKPPEGIVAHRGTSLSHSFMGGPDRLLPGLVPFGAIPQISCTPSNPCVLMDL